VTYTSLITPTDNDPIDNLARYRVSATDRNVADPKGTLVLALPRTRPNHNGGMIEFGADGYLYLGTGDGGGHGDPIRYAQNPRALHGKMLRLDVHQRAAGREYGIPPGNPFADGVAGAPEVFMLGLRNPWRWSFDRATGDLWIGDVGQGQVEELDVARAGEQAGKNFGWSVYEGTGCCATQADLCTQAAPPQPCDPAGKTFPLDSRARATGWASIIGGQVYRVQIGPCHAALSSVGSSAGSEDCKRSRAPSRCALARMRSCTKSMKWSQSPLASMHRSCTMASTRSSIQRIPPWSQRLPMMFLIAPSTAPLPSSRSCLMILS